MNKYNIENNIDFYSELYKLLDDDIENNLNDNNSNNNNNNDNLCLITNEPLIDKYVTLECNHKFNYIPLYKDILNHKSKYNNMESTQSRLRENEIRCPYCRHRYSYTLPYYEELGLDKITGINTLDPKFKKYNISNNSSSKFKQCEYVGTIQVLDDDKEETEEIQCNCSTMHFIKNNENEIKYFCYKHSYLMVKQYKKEAREKLKNEKLLEKEKLKNAKLLEKEKLKVEKIELKLKEKLEKQQLKTSKKSSKQVLNKLDLNLDEENVVLGPLVINVSAENTSNTNIINGCTQILKTGENKGNHCNCKIFKDQLCKRHYNINNKENKDNL
jgi:hypothetical protein